MKNTVIFDLDGTLLDTLGDLTDSVNHALSQNGLPVRSIEEIRTFVGDGVWELIRRAVPADSGQNLTMQCLSEFRDHYRINMCNRTRPYPGILELLATLHEKGYRIAVASNKFDGAVKALCQHYFGRLLDVAVGEQEGFCKKPAPDLIHHCLDMLGRGPEQSIYVGDSEIDIQTARNAGILCLSVTWGFRDRMYLQAQGALCIVDTAQELLEQLLHFHSSDLRSTDPVREE